jgi:hypothetical protein
VDNAFAGAGAAPAATASKYERIARGRHLRHRRRRAPLRPLQRTADAKIAAKARLGPATFAAWASPRARP